MRLGKFLPIAPVWMEISISCSSTNATAGAFHACMFDLSYLSRAFCSCPHVH